MRLRESIPVVVLSPTRNGMKSTQKNEKYSACQVSSRQILSLEFSCHCTLLNKIGLLYLLCYILLQLAAYCCTLLHLVVLCCILPCILCIIRMHLPMLKMMLCCIWLHLAVFDCVLQYIAANGYFSLHLATSCSTMHIIALCCI